MIKTRHLLYSITVISSICMSMGAFASTELDFIQANKEYTKAYRDFLHFEKTALDQYKQFNTALEAAEKAAEVSFGFYTVLDAELSILNNELIENISTSQSNEDLILMTQNEQKDTLDQAVADGLFQPGEVIDQQNIADKANVYTQKINELKQEVSELNDEIVQIKTSEPYSGFIGKQSGLEFDLTQNQANKQRYEERIAWFERRINEINFEIQSTEDKIIRLEQLAREIRTQTLPGLNSEQFALEKDLDGLKLDIRNLDTQVVAVRRRVRERRRDLDNINKRLETRTKERSRLRREADGLKAEIDKIPNYQQRIQNIQNKRLPEAQQNLDGTKKKLSKGQSQIKVKSENLQQAQLRLQNIDGQIKQLNQKIQDEQQGVQKLLQRKKNLKTQISEAQAGSSNQSEIKGNIQEAQQKIQQARQRKQNLTQQIQNKDGQLQNANADLQAAKNKLQQTEEQLQKLQQRKQKVQTDITSAQSAKQKVEQLNGQIESARGKKQSAHGQVQQLSNQKKNKETQKKQAQSEVKGLNGQIKQKNQQLANVNSKIKETQAKINSGKGNKKTLKKKLQEFRQRKDKLTQQKQGSNQKKNQAQNKVKGLNSQIRELTQEIQNNRKVVQNQTQRIQDLQAEKQNIQALVQKLPQLKNQLGKINSQIQNKRKEVNQSQSAVAAAEKKIVPTSQEIKKLRAQRNQQQKVIDTQLARKKSLENQLAEAKKLAQSLPDLRQGLARVEAQLEGIQKKLAEMRTQKQQVQEKKQQVTARIGKLQNDLQALRKEKGLLEQQKNKVAKNIEHMNQQVKNLKSNIQAAESGRPRMREIRSNVLPKVRQRIQALQQDSNQKKNQLNQAVQRRDRLVADLDKKSLEKNAKQRQLARVNGKIAFEGLRLVRTEVERGDARSHLVALRDELILRRRQKREDEDSLSITKSLIAENQQELFQVEQQIAQYEFINIQPIESNITEVEAAIAQEQLGESKFHNLGQTLQLQDDLVATKTEENQALGERLPHLKQEIADLELKVAQANEVQKSDALVLMEADQALEQHKVAMDNKQPELEALEEKNFELLDKLAGQ